MKHNGRLILRPAIFTWLLAIDWKLKCLKMNIVSEDIKKGIQDVVYLYIPNFFILDLNGVNFGVKNKNQKMNLLCDNLLPKVAKRV